MSESQDKPLVVLGITGGIAAYKAADLCSRLVKSGLDVQVIMSPHATEFVTPLTFMTLSRHRVITTLFDMVDVRPEHVALAERATLFAVAPCTANFIGKLANGIADDALSTFAITHGRETLLAPAMNPAMWNHPAVQHNIDILRARGLHFVGPAAGHVACGQDGIGRMSDPEEICSAVLALLPRR